MKLGRTIAKRVAYAAFGSPWALRRRLDRIRRSGAVTILNLHRVHQHDGSDYPPLDPALFEELLGFVSTRFSVVSFAELDRPAPRPKMILSFDDGYRDFFTNAVPLLAQYRLRVNQNIIPRCVETGLPPLNVMAQDFVGRAPAELVRSLDVPGFTIEAGPALGGRLSAFLKYKSQSEQDALADHLVPQFHRFEGFRPTPMMSLEEVRQIAGAHELGGHSYAHSSMAHESDAFLRDDIARCEAWFAEKLGQEMRIYAFPNGSCRDGQIALVRAAGIDHVLLVGEAFAEDVHVPRRFTYGASGRAEARFRALGALAPVPA